MKRKYHVLVGDTEQSAVFNVNKLYDAFGLVSAYAMGHLGVPHAVFFSDAHEVELRDSTPRSHAPVMCLMVFFFLMSVWDVPEGTLTMRIPKGSSVFIIVNREWV